MGVKSNSTRCGGPGGTAKPLKSRSRSFAHFPNLGAPLTIRRPCSNVEQPALANPARIERMNSEILDEVNPLSDR